MNVLYKTIMLMACVGLVLADDAAKTKKKEIDIWKLRHQWNIKPVFRLVDTCAGEFNSKTPYLYSTYDWTFDNSKYCEANPTNQKKIIILGSGPNRIGQGIEFDYCCVHAVYVLKELGIELGFKQIMTIEPEKGMKKINNSFLEIARQDHAEIFKRMNWWRLHYSHPIKIDIII